MVVRSAMAFQRAQEIDRIWVVTGEDQMDMCRSAFAGSGITKLQGIVAGGSMRQDSVRSGLAAMDTDIVLIHDGARPFVSTAIIERVTAAAEHSGAAICGVPVKDTIRRETDAGAETLDRSQLRSVQTPQGFERQLLQRAMEKAYADGYYGTDEAGLVERLGHRVTMVDGEYGNIKVTTKEDLPMEIRTGSGYDVHRLVAGRPLILGGKQIDFPRGLEGHSDADVLLHAVMDALLGAAAMGDIGRHFPDTDEKYRGASSMDLLRQVRAMIEKEGYAIANLDVTLIAERPKVAAYIDEMKKNISAAANVAPERVNIKGTTTEGLGFTGTGEGIACQAVCILTR